MSANDKVVTPQSLEQRLKAREVSRTIWELVQYIFFSIPQIYKDSHNSSLQK